MEHWLLEPPLERTWEPPAEVLTGMLLVHRLEQKPVEPFDVKRNQLLYCSSRCRGPAREDAHGPFQPHRIPRTQQGTL
jgi:hypothetical protein